MQKSSFVYSLVPYAFMLFGSFVRRYWNCLLSSRALLSLGGRRRQLAEFPTCHYFGPPPLTSAEIFPSRLQLCSLLHSVPETLIKMAPSSALPATSKKAKKPQPTPKAPLPLPSTFSTAQAEKAVKALLAHHAKVSKQKEEEQLLPREEHVWVVVNTKTGSTRRSLNPVKMWVVSFFRFLSLETRVKLDN